MAAVVLAVVLGIILPRVDLLVDGSLPTAVDSAVFNGGAETARAVLSSIAGSLITATSLTFSLTVIALQLASGQASPRVLRLFARDRQVHWTLAAFLGTFAYSITVLRSVRSETEDIPEFVPRLSVTLAFVLTLVSVVMLVFFLAHLATQLRVETMLKEIHADTDRTIDVISGRSAEADRYSHPVDRNGEIRVVTATSSGFITGRDLDRLLECAASHAIVVQEDKRVGENVLAGTPLAYWWPAALGALKDEPALEDAVRSAYSIGYERTAAEDIDFGVQQVLDIALRALSPGVNDPTTAVHAVGHLGAITARMLTMDSVPAAVRGPQGQLCVVTKTRTQGEILDAALMPIRHYGAEHPAVVKRFLQLITELSYACREDPAIVPALIAQLDALDQRLRSAETDPASSADLLSSVHELRVRLAAK